MKKQKLNTVKVSTKWWDIVMETVVESSKLRQYSKELKKSIKNGITKCEHVEQECDVLICDVASQGPYNYSAFVLWTVHNQKVGGIVSDATGKLTQLNPSGMVHHENYVIYPRNGNFAIDSESDGPVIANHLLRLRGLEFDECVDDIAWMRLFLDMNIVPIFDQSECLAGVNIEGVYYT